MLAGKNDLHSAFINTETGGSKELDCIRVDGATDEGPGHDEVQFFWSEWHYTPKKVVTFLTARSSGSSYLNRVELQNSCLSHACSNTFIPSTLSGSCIDPETGHIDQIKLHSDLHLAIDAYIHRVTGFPFGDTRIHLCKGANSEKAA